MSLAALYEEAMTPSLQLIEDMRMVRRGYQDGMSGVCMASESPIYASAHMGGRVLGWAERGQAVLSFGDAWTCAQCGIVRFGVTKECHCGKSKGIIRGIIGAHGEDSQEEAPKFMTNDMVMSIIADGVRVITENGIDITTEFTLPQ